jgi:hypothetical protein
MKEGGTRTNLRLIRLEDYYLNINGIAMKTDNVDIDTYSFSFSDRILIQTVDDVSNSNIH